MHPYFSFITPVTIIYLLLQLLADFEAEYLAVARIWLQSMKTCRVGTISGRITGKRGEKIAFVFSLLKLRSRRGAFAPRLCAVSLCCVFVLCLYAVTLHFAFAQCTMPLCRALHGAFVRCFSWCLCAVLCTVPLCSWSLPWGYLFLHMPLRCTSALCLCTVLFCGPLHSAIVFALCLCAMPLRHAFVLCLYAVPLRFAFAQCLCTVLCMVPLCGHLHSAIVRSLAWCLCVVLCMVPFCGSLHGFFVQSFAQCHCAVLCKVPLCCAFMRCLCALPLHSAFVRSFAWCL